MVYPFLPMLQYPAAFFTLFGYYLVGSTDPKNRAYGFEFGLIGNIIWIVYAIWGNNPVLWGVIITNFALFFGAIRGLTNNIDTLTPKLYDYMVKNGMIPGKSDKK